VGVKEEGKTFDAQVAVTVVSAGRCVYLRVGVQVTNALDVHNNGLVVGALECEVTERLGCVP